MQRMQTFTYLKGPDTFELSLPDADKTIVSGVRWGNPCTLFTPAYWYTQYVMRGPTQTPTRHRLGLTFAEEVAACVLGGYGIPAEVGKAAFEHVKQTGLIQSLCDDATVLEHALCEPLRIENRMVRYRFWKKKASYLASAFRHLRFTQLPLDDALELRNELLALPGIGPKTASWIVRNWTGSNAIAILDIHIVRAGVLMNLFGLHERVEKDYLQMEMRFVALANNLTVPTSDLDALIWSMMRTTPYLVAQVLRSHNRLYANSGAA